MTKTMRGGVLALALAVLTGPAAPASAKEFQVNATVDAADAKPGDRICATTFSGCTVRAAVMEANATPGLDVVLIPAGRFLLTIPERSMGDDERSGDVDISDPIAIRGAGARATVIAGAGKGRLFTNGYSGVAMVSDLTLTGGDATEGSDAIGLGGAFYNQGTATLERIAAIGNKAGGGGAVFTIPRTYLTVRDSLLANNQAVEGGALRIDSGGEVVNTTIVGNRLYEDPTAQAVPVDELSGDGGGIDHRGGNDVAIVNSTIVGNHALKGGGGLSSGQGYTPISSDVELGRVRLRNSIIAGNTSARGAADCRTNAVVHESTGHNIDGDGTCNLDQPTDLPGRDPLLGALGDHGGPTDALMPLPASPAIDGAGSDVCPRQDQRGVARPVGAACDIGAVEYVPAAPAAARSASCRRTVAVPRRLRARALRFDVLVAGRVVARRRRPHQRVRVLGGRRRLRATLRIRMRDGRTVRVRRTVRACST